MELGTIFYASSRSAGFQPAVSPTSSRQTTGKPAPSRVRGACGLEIRDTAQRGGAATKGAWSSSSARNQLNPDRAELELCAPRSKNLRVTRRFMQILRDWKSALHDLPHDIA